MNTINIKRYRLLSNDHQTMGEIYFNGSLIGKCVEQPWANNLKGHSSIPAGTYQLRPHTSPKHPNTVSFHNPALNVYAEDTLVPAGIDHNTIRSECLIHSANYASQLEGCVAPGITYMKDPLGNIIGVGSSKDAIDKLVTLWGDRSNLQAIIEWV